MTKNKYTYIFFIGEDQEKIEKLLGLLSAEVSIVSHYSYFDRAYGNYFQACYLSVTEAVNSKRVDYFALPVIKKYIYLHSNASSIFQALKKKGYTIEQIIATLRKNSAIYSNDDIFRFLCNGIDLEIEISDIDDIQSIVNMIRDFININD